MVLRSELFKIIPASFLSFSLMCCTENNSPSQKQPTSTDTSKEVQETTRLLSYEERQGKQLYTKFCAVCHGEEGKGDGFNAFNLDPKPRDLSEVQYMIELSDERLLETISQGGRGVNKSVFMPSWGGRLHKDEVGYIISYLKVLRGNKE